MSHIGRLRRHWGMRIAIIGGTGTLGRQIAAVLRDRGHEVRVLSRSVPEYRVDLRTGAGLGKGLRGCQAVVDASNDSSRNATEVMVEGTRRLLAAEQAAGVALHVRVSIVGCEQVPIGYFRAKAAQEGLVRHGPVPWTIVAATQFHELASTAAPRNQAELAQMFQAQRPRLLRLAYATTGSLAEAEDVVQEAWLRLARLPDPGQVRELGAWLTTTVSRLALDALTSARARREHHMGPWLPEPLVETVGAAPDPADRVTLDESVSMALLVVLERLSPAERTAFVLHDVFGLAFTEVADVTGRSVAAVRQLAGRARRHVEQGRPRFPPTPAQQAKLVSAFAAACAGGDMQALTALLDPDVVWRADGGKVRAEPREARGAARVARLLVGFARRPPKSARLTLVNGGPGLVIHDSDDVLSVVSLTVDAGRITAIDIIRDPDKLTAVPDAAGGPQPHA
jgi:RNA polymerase sigma-70 factor (ECF subfamily)